MNVSANLSDLPSLLLDNLKSSNNTKAKRSQFVNRSEELGRLEQAIDNEDTRIVTIFGIHGIGKKSLIKRAKEIFFDQANIVGVQVKPGLDLVALSLDLAYKAEIEMPSVFNSEEEVKGFVRSTIEILHSRGFFIAFYDIQYWLEEEGGFGKELNYIFQLVSEIKALENRPIFLTTTRRLDVPMEHLQYHQMIRIDAINSEHLVTIINNWLELQAGKREDKESLKPIASMIFGYPFAARIAASLVDKYGTDYLIKYPKEIVNLRVDIAKYLLGEIKISVEAIKLLELIALIDGPLPAEDLAAALEYSDIKFRAAVDEALSAGLLFHEEGFFNVHPLVQDYYYRSISNGTEFISITKRIAVLAKRRIELVQVGSPLHSKLLPCVFRLVALSGKYNEALELRRDLLGYLGQVVRDLYDSREYKLALSYCEHILDDNPGDWNIRLYYARCLIRLDRVDEAEPVLLSMNEERPKDAMIFHTLGRLEMSRDRWQEALGWFSKAISERANNLASIRDSAECFFQLKDLVQAEGYVKRAKELDAMNPFVLQVESKIYEEQKDYDSAYQVMSVALSLDRNNPSFNHRMGRISEHRKEYDLAKQHYIKAIEADEKFYESRLSLVNLKIELYEFDGVEEELDQLAEIVPGRKQDVLRNVKAKYLLNSKGDLEGAERLVEVNIKYKRDPHSFSIRARIEIKKSDKQRSLGYSSLADQHLKNALQIVRTGSALFENNTMLRDVEDEIVERLGGSNSETG